MATVPYSPNLTAAPSPSPGGGQLSIAVDASMFGGQEAAATQRFGQQLERVGQNLGSIAEQVQKQQNSTAVDDAFNQLQSKALNRLYGDGTEANPGFYSLKGRNAMDAAKPTIESMEEDRQALKNVLQNDAQKLAFEQASRRFHWDQQQVVGRHASQQAAVWDIATQQAAERIKLDAIGKTSFSEQEFQENLADGEAAAAKKAASAMGDPTVIAAEKLRFHNQAYETRALSMAATSPSAALRWMQQNQDHFDPHKFLTLQNQIESKADGADARTAADQAYNGRQVTGAGDRPRGVTARPIEPDARKRADAVSDGLVKRGLDQDTAIGFAANALHESAANHSTGTGDGGMSHGLFMWNRERLAAFQARYHHLPEQGTLDEALDFVVAELNSPQYAGAKAAIEAARGPAAKAAAISRAFLIPKDVAGEQTRRSATATELAGRPGLRLATSGGQPVTGATPDGTRVTPASTRTGGQTATPLYTYTPDDKPPVGLVEPGNIDLNARKVFRDADGIRTEQSMSFRDTDGREVLIPTIVDGKPVNEQTAIEHYRDTKEHLGKFDTPEHADAYAGPLHQRQGRYYGEQKQTTGSGTDSALPDRNRAYQSILDSNLSDRSKDLALRMLDLRYATEEKARKDAEEKSADTITSRIIKSPLTVTPEMIADDPALTSEKKAALTRFWEGRMREVTGITTETEKRKEEATTNAVVSQIITDPTKITRADIANLDVSAARKENLIQFHNSILNEQRTTDTRERKADEDATTDRLVSQIIRDPSKLTRYDIANDPTLSGPRQESLYKFLEARQNETAVTHDVKTYGPGFWDAYKAIHAPPGDPNRITDPNAIYNRAGPNGDLTVSGADKLLAELKGRGTPEGTAESEMRNQFLKTARGEITGRSEMYRLHDPKGETLFLKFLGGFFPAYQKQKDAGISPTRLLTPGNPDYLGNDIHLFKRPMKEWMEDMQSANEDIVAANKPGANPAATKPAFTREQIEAEMQRRGLLKPPAAPPAPARPMVPID